MPPAGRFRSAISRSRRSFLQPRGAHSEKPAIFRDLIEELCGHRPRIELFARSQAACGWDVWGAEATDPGWAADQRHGRGARALESKEG